MLRNLYKSILKEDSPHVKAFYVTEKEMTHRKLLCVILLVTAHSTV